MKSYAITWNSKPQYRNPKQAQNKNYLNSKLSLIVCRRSDSENCDFEHSILLGAPNKMKTSYLSFPRIFVIPANLCHSRESLSFLRKRESREPNACETSFCYTLLVFRISCFGFSDNQAAFVIRIASHDKNTVLEIIGRATAIRWCAEWLLQRRRPINHRQEYPNPAVILRVFE